MTGPVRLTDAATTTLRPLPGVGLDPKSHLGRWQQTTLTNTIPHCIDELDNYGALDNLRRIHGDRGTPHRPPRFSDSDVHKTLEACGWSASQLDFVAATAKLLAEVQEPDGYLNSWTQGGEAERFTDFSHGHEMYCAGHLIQAAIATVRTTGDRTLLDIAIRFADLLCDLFTEKPVVPGHPEIETALVELYRETEVRRYLTLASQFIERRGHGLLDTKVTQSPYFQDHQPVRETTDITGHAVRATYLAAGATDVAVETNDTELLGVMEALWQGMVDTKTYLTGGIGSRHAGEAFGDPYELPPDRAYAETCAAIASFMWSWRLLLATGKQRYADLMERTLYNGFAASTSLDGLEYFYVNPLQVRSEHRRHSWYGCACCPPNIARLVASLPHYLATYDDAGIQLHQYFSGTLDADGTQLNLDTAYPWGGTITITVTQTPTTPWALTLRIPEWCAHATLTVNGEAVPVTTAVERTWTAGDTVILTLDLTPRITRPHPRVDAIRGCVALERGPLVYSLEETDQTATPFEDLRIDPSHPIDVVERPDLLGGTIALQSDALTAIPYFQWANRDRGAMRVWIPMTS